MSMYSDVCCEADPRSETRSADGLWRFLGKLRDLWTARRHRARILALTHLDERMLTDIGITSSDVQMALSAPFGEDPSLTLRRLAGERRAARRQSVREAAAELPRSTILVSLGPRFPDAGRRQR